MSIKEMTRSQYGLEQHGVLLGQNHGTIMATQLAEVVAKKKPVDLHLMTLAQVLAK